MNEKPNSTTLAAGAPPQLAGAARSNTSLVTRALEAVAFVLLFVGLEWLSFLHEQDGYSVTPWNPGLGIAFAMIIYRGVPFVAVFFAGVLAAELTVAQSSLPWRALLAVSMTAVVSYSVMGLAARRRLKLDAPLEGSRDVTVIVIAGVIGAALDAAFLTGVLSMVGGFKQVLEAMLALVVGDLIGIAVFAPLVLRLLQYRMRPLPRPQPKTLAEIVLYVAMIVIALFIALRPAEGWPRDMFYLLFLPVVIASVRFGVDGACASLALVQLGLVTMLHLHGFDLRHFTDYQVMMLVLTLAGLILGGLSSERQAAEAGARRAAQRVAELQAEAARADRFNIVSGMSAALAHEISQPMTAARALARAIEALLRRSDADVERAAANAGKLVEQIDNAGAIVSRMREFLRRGEPHISTVDLGTLLRDSITLARPLAASRQIEISLKLTTDAPPIHVDSIQMQQVIMNLVLNSIEAIAEAQSGEGRIELAAARTEGAIEFAVTDNGIGVPEARAESIFEPLNTSRASGTGLGLPICRSIIEAHGGRIWLHASRPGRTEFRFTIPIEHRHYA